MGEMERGGGRDAVVFSDGEKTEAAEVDRGKGGKSMGEVEIRSARGWKCR